MPMVSRADYLYWMFDEGNVNNLSGSSEFKYAKISVKGADVMLGQSSNPGPGIEPIVEVVTTEGQPKAWYADLADYGGAGSVFLLELYDEKGHTAWSTVTWDQIQNSIYEGGGGKTPEKVFSSWGMVIPESTSGVLTLVGLALLALRRKRA